MIDAYVIDLLRSSIKTLFWEIITNKLGYIIVVNYGNIL